MSVLEHVGVVVGTLAWLYLFCAPRSWKPWARRTDKKRAQWQYYPRPWYPRYDMRADARADKFIAATEESIAGNTTDPAIMKIEHDHLVDAGLLDPDQPTAWSTYQWRKEMTKEFTPQERMLLRLNNQFARPSD